MKKKDWISLFAIAAILVVAFMGTLIVCRGEVSHALSQTAILALPMIIFMVLAVWLASRRGNYAGMFRYISWGCFAAAMVCLCLNAVNFCHYINMKDASVARTFEDNVNAIANDIHVMNSTFTSQTSKRIGDYEQFLKNTYNSGDKARLKKVSNTQNWNIDGITKYVAIVNGNFTGVHTALHQELQTHLDNVNEQVINNFNVFTAGPVYDNFLAQYSFTRDSLTRFYNVRLREEPTIPKINFAQIDRKYASVSYILTNARLSLVGCALFALFACLGAVCFLAVPDSRIKRPKDRKDMASVYDTGIDF